MIDLQRVDELISGVSEPQNSAEELFILAYNSGISEELFFHCMLSLGNSLDKLTLEEIHYFMLGYAMGQADKLTNELDELLENNKPAH